MNIRVASVFALLCVCITIVTSASVNAGDKPAGHGVFAHQTSEELTSHCRAFMQWRRTGLATVQESHDAGLCYGFVMGVVDAFYFQGEPIFRTFLGGSICLPEKTNARSLTEIVARFVDQNPELRHLAPVELVLRALAHSYPCQK